MKHITCFDHLLSCRDAEVEISDRIYRLGKLDKRTLSHIPISPCETFLGCRRYFLERRG